MGESDPEDLRKCKKFEWQMASIDLLDHANLLSAMNAAVGIALFIRAKPAQLNVQIVRREEWKHRQINDRDWLIGLNKVLRACTVRFLITIMDVLSYISVYGSSFGGSNSYWLPEG
jgi:hypothetical protein